MERNVFHWGTCCHLSIYFIHVPFQDTIHIYQSIPEAKITDIILKLTINKNVILNAFHANKKKQQDGVL